MTLGNALMARATTSAVWWLGRAPGEALEVVAGPLELRQLSVAAALKRGLRRVENLQAEARALNVRAMLTVKELGPAIDSGYEFLGYSRELLGRPATADRRCQKQRQPAGEE